jgi:hypothetical protein
MADRSGEPVLHEGLLKQTLKFSHAGVSIIDILFLVLFMEDSARHGARRMRKELTRISSFACSSMISKSMYESPSRTNWLGLSSEHLLGLLCLDQMKKGRSSPSTVSQGRSNNRRICHRRPSPRRRRRLRQALPDANQKSRRQRAPCWEEELRAGQVPERQGGTARVGGARHESDARDERRESGQGSRKGE